MLDLVNEDFSRRDYINADFILAGAVDVERLWSKVGNLLVDNRMRMSSSMMQTIMILKENRNMLGSTEVLGLLKEFVAEMRNFMLLVVRKKYYN